MKGMGFAYREELSEERCGATIPGIHSTCVGIEPLFCFPQEGKGKQTESNGIFGDSLDGQSAANLQELSQMSACILVSHPTEWVGLHHVD